MRLPSARLLILIPILLMGGNLAAQQDFAAYHLRCHKAARLADAGKPDSALMLYAEAFQLVDTPRATELHAARQTCLRFRKQAPDQSAEYDFQSAVYERCAQEQDKAVDRRYAAYIHRLGREDQRVRGKKYSRAAEILEACNLDPGCRRKTAGMRRATRRMRELRATDSTNITLLLKKIESSGFPSARRVGPQAAMDAFIILLHFDRDSLNEELGPVLEPALKTGEIDPEQYAWIADRRLSWAQGKEPRYYQLPVGDALNDPARLEAINRRRASIGLPDIAESFSISSKGSKTVITIQ
jgi:hypothetical protein